jgi:hypothetical protein
MLLEMFQRNNKVAGASANVVSQLTTRTTPLCEEIETESSIRRHNNRGSKDEQVMEWKRGSALISCFNQREIKATSSFSNMMAVISSVV